MRTIEIEKLIQWLGRDGAIAGLEGSDITTSELCDIAAHYGLTVEKRTRRGDLIVELVNRDVVRIDKTKDELLAMKYDDLKEYFRNKKVSKTELLNLLLQFDIRLGRGANTSLVDFVAREISDFGMYQRVARGARGA